MADAPDLGSGPERGGSSSLPARTISFSVSTCALDATTMSDMVKCPICNAKVPFSLPMHMHMVHGPGGRPVDEPAFVPANDPGLKSKEKRDRKSTRLNSSHLV